VGECEHDHQGQDLSGEWAGIRPRPGRRLSLALSRGGTAGRGGRRRVAVPASRRPVVARRYASLRHRASPIGAGAPSNGADDSFAVKARRLGRSLRSRPFGMAQAPPETAPSHGKTIGTYQVGRGRLAAGSCEQIGQQPKTSASGLNPSFIPADDFRRGRVRYLVPYGQARCGQAISPAMGSHLHRGPPAMPPCVRHPRRHPRGSPMERPVVRSGCDGTMPS
jgi:hypothetical protein